MIRASHLYGLLCIALLAPNIVRAQVDDANPIDDNAAIELSGTQLDAASGFIVDRTITNFGAEFVREFSHAWRTEPGTEKLDLTILEKPSARWGSTIFVEYNGHAIAKVFLYAGRSATIKPLAIDTAHYMAGKLADQALMSLILHDPDLGKEELP